MRKYLRELRELLPCLLPVKVRCRPIPGHDSYTTLVRGKDGRPSHFWIVINSEIKDWVRKRDALFHEWGHARAWVEGRTTCDHDAEWGVAHYRFSRR